MKYKIDNECHHQYSWLVQRLAHDFELLDVWEFPIAFDERDGDSLYLFRKHAIERTLKEAFDFSPSGVFFRVRACFGKVFSVDKHVNQLTIPDCSERSVADRMSDADKSLHHDDRNIDIRTDNFLDFNPVYSLENETLNEISNSTEHTLMHYAWVPKEKHCYRVQLSNYVKHRNSFGKLYVSGIEPFRYNIVYPYLFSKFEKYWNDFKLNN